MPTDPYESLVLILDHGVQFIIVGGVAAVLNGAPVQTFDLDLVYAQTPDNITRTLAALEALDAIFRIQPERKLRPNLSHLSAIGHLNLLTRNGPLDLLATIGNGLGYDELLPLSTYMRISETSSVPVLGLETLIRLKEELGGDKDKAMLPVLRRTLQERQKS